MEQFLKKIVRLIIRVSFAGAKVTLMMAGKDPYSLCFGGLVGCDGVTKVWKLNGYRKDK